MFPESLPFLRNAKKYNNFSYILFKLVPSCNYALLTATAELMETFLEVIL